MLYARSPWSRQCARPEWEMVWMSPKGWRGLRRAASPGLTPGFLSPILLQRTLWAVWVLRGGPSHLCFQRLRGLLDHTWVEIYRLLINGILEDSAKSFPIPQMVCSVAGLVPGIWKCRFITSLAWLYWNVFFVLFVVVFTDLCRLFFFYYFFFKLCLDIIYMTYIETLYDMLFVSNVGFSDVGSMYSAGK